MTRTVTAKHAIITDTCRTNRTDEDAIDEALARVREEFLLDAPAWPIGCSTKFHVKLEIEREV